MSVQGVLSTKVAVAAAAGVVISLAPASPAAPVAAAVMCEGQEATIVATEGGQTVEGTDGPDVIAVGEFEGVTIHGNGGDDLICAGDDFHSALVYGGPGDDAIFGDGTTTRLAFTTPTGVTIDVEAGSAEGEGVDTFGGIHAFIASPGPDVFVGSADSDTFTDPDFLESDSEKPLVPDVISGRGSGDFLKSRYGTIDGGGGDDLIDDEGGIVNGGRGDDWIRIYGSGVGRGDEGDDQLTMWEAAEAPSAESPIRLVGGVDDDTFRLQAPGAVGQVAGGAGLDQLYFGGDGSPVEADLMSGVATYSGGGRIDMSGVENLNGTTGDDVLRGSSAGNVLKGYAGDDVLYGRGGNDLLRAGSGIDDAFGGHGRDACKAAETKSSC